MSAGTAIRPPARPPIAGFLSATLWARFPRSLILRRMQPDQRLRTRIYHALMLWSVCAPSPSDIVILKNEWGDAVLSNGQTEPAGQEDIRRLLNLDPGMRGEISRQFTALIDDDWLRQTDDGSYYLNPTPAVAVNESQVDLNVAEFRNIKISKLLITKEQILAASDDSEVVIAELKAVKAALLADLQAAHAKATTAARTLCERHRIELKNGKSATRKAATNGNGNPQQNGGNSRNSIIIDSDTTREKLASQPAPEEPATSEPAHREPIRALVRERFPESTYADSENDKTNAALKGAPLERLRRRMAERAKDGQYRPGVIALLAGEVGDAWVRERSASTRGQPPPQQPVRDLGALLADLRARWDELSETERSGYCEIYPELLE